LYAEILWDARFPETLWKLDEELARAARVAGCPHCGAVLDTAHYARKPRGGPWALSDELCRRLSYCCRRDGCRRRMTPPSVRFAGRRVYLGAIVVLAAVLQQGPTRWRVARLQSILGTDRRTLVRWRRWWTTAVASSRTFLFGRADFMPPPAGETLPTSLLDGFVGTGSERLVAALGWLARQFGSRFPGDGDGSAQDAR